MERRRTPRPDGSGAGLSWRLGLSVYVVVFAVLTVFDYLVFGDPLGAVGPFVGGLIAALILRSRWCRRFAHRVRQGRWGAGPPEDRWR